MVQKFKKILALGLTLTVLVSSHSFAWFEHLCTLTQVKKLSFALESCAGTPVETPPAHTTLKKGTCCKITVKVNKANSAVQQSVNLAGITWVTDEITVPVFTFNALTALRSEKQIMGYADASPPPALPLYLLNEQFII